MNLNSKKMKRQIGPTILGIFITFNLAIACVNLSHPLWIDEGIASLPSESILKYGLPYSPFDLDVMPWQLKYNMWDPATPLYRYAEAAFTALFGFSTESTRFFSLFCAALLLGILYFLFKSVGNRYIALFAVSILSASPVFLSMARQARHFTFLMLMIALTLYFWHRRFDKERNYFLWAIFALATLLTQVMGYLLIFILAVYVLVNLNEKYLSKRYIWAYVGLGLVYLAIFIPFHETLAFFHQVDCSTRADGCHKEMTYYVHTIFERFLNGSAFFTAITQAEAKLHLSIFGLTEINLNFNPGIINMLSLFFAYGLVHMSFKTWAGRRKKLLLILLWIFVPFFMLSLREVKFDRYLLMYALPPLSFIAAYGIYWLGQALFQKKGRQIAMYFLLLPCLFLFKPSANPALQTTSSLQFRSAYLDYLDKGIVNRPRDNIEGINYQLAILKGERKPGDIVITSYNDTSLTFYLKEKVYGMLASSNTDQKFMHLIKKAKANKSRVFFIDTLAERNFCYISTTELRNIDCRKKFAKFYSFCAADKQAKVCRRIIIGHNKLRKKNI